MRLKYLLLAVALALAGAFPALAQQQAPNAVNGCQYVASPVRMSAWQKSVFLCDPFGGLLVSSMPSPVGAVRGSGVATASTAAISFTGIAAPAAGLKVYLTGVQCGRTDTGTTASYVTLNDAASTILTLANSGGGGGNNQVYATPLALAAATAPTFTSSASLSSVFCNAQGYVAP